MAELASSMPQVFYVLVPNLTNQNFLREERALVYTTSRRSLHLHGGLRLRAGSPAGQTLRDKSLSYAP